MKKPYLFGLLAIAGAAGLFSLYSINTVKAEDVSGESLIDRIVAKFNLNQTEVDKVVEDFRSERQTERRAELETRLSQAVTDGKITEEQKAKILAKITEWQSNKGDWHNMTQEQRREQLEKHRAEMQAFEDELGIDISEIIGKGPGRMGKGGFGRGGMGK